MKQKFDGETYRFTYKCEKINTSDAGLRDHSGQQAEVIRKLGRDEVDEDIVGRMYHVEFPDGFAGDVFEEELGEHLRLCWFCGEELTDPYEYCPACHELQE